MHQRVAEHASLKCATLTYRLFPAEDDREETGTRKSLCPPSICQKVGHKFLKVSPLPLSMRKGRNYPAEKTLDSYQPEDGTRGIYTANFTN